MVLASIVMSHSSMLVATVNLDEGTKDTLILRLAMFLGWQNHMCPDYKLSLVEGANGKLLQISSAVIQRIQSENSVFRTIFLVLDYFSVESTYWQSFYKLPRQLYSSY